MKSKQPKTERPVTTDVSVLLGIYSAQSAARLDYNERKWETVRSASLLIFGLLAGVGAIATSEVARSTFVLGLLGVSLWVVGIAVYFWTNSNLRRESELQYFVEFSMYQIEKLLGAHGTIPKKSQWLPPYKYIFNEKNLSYKFRAEMDRREFKNDPVKAWVNSRIKRHNFLKTVNAFSFILLFICLWVGGVLLIIAIWGPQLHSVLISNAPRLLPTLIATSTP